MEVKIIMGSKLSNTAVKELFDEYKKRLLPYFDVSFLDFKSFDSRSEDEVKKLTSDKLYKLSEGYYRILLDEKGSLYNSAEFSEWLSGLIESKKKVAFIIGGSYGHHRSLTEKCDEIISLSRLTFAHQISLAVLAEQLYRGVSIAHGHPYHK